MKKLAILMLIIVIGFSAFAAEYKVNSYLSIIGTYQEGFTVSDNICYQVIVKK